MVLFDVHKSDGTTCRVAILPYKNKQVFRFVNLTKGHICQCEFESVKDAIHDMDDRISKGLIIKYERVE